MICRIWHGWTPPENADTYENLLREEIVPRIHGRKIPGFQRIQVMRRAVEEEVEFITIMWFDNLDAVRTFAGEDYEASVVPEKAQQVLAHYDARSQHYDICFEVFG